MTVKSQYPANYANQISPLHDSEEDEARDTAIDTLGDAAASSAERDLSIFLLCALEKIEEQKTVLGKRRMSDSMESILFTEADISKLEDYRSAAGLPSYYAVVALLITKGLPTLWWDLELAQGKAGKQSTEAM